MKLRRALLLLTVLWLPASAAQDAVDERAMKAAFLYNFAVFTQWPAPVEDDFVLCVLGRTRLDEALGRLEGREVRDGIRLSVRHIAAGEPLVSCRVLYVGELQGRGLDALLTDLEGQPVLTVTDADELADRGIMIEMRKQGPRLAFDVNLPAARRARLDFSARLLRLAAFVARDT